MVEDSRGEIGKWWHWVERVRAIRCDTNYIAFSLCLEGNLNSVFDFFLVVVFLCLRQCVNYSSLIVRNQNEEGANFGSI